MHEVYRQVPDTIEGLECTKFGNFRFHGREIGVYRYTRASGRKMSAKIRFEINGKRYDWTAAKLVAMTWVSSYGDANNYIVYRDGDIHNIASDNLIIVDQKTYYKNTKGRDPFKTLEGQKERLQLIIDEANLTLHYFKTLDMNPINKHVEEFLYNYLIDYCNGVYCYGWEKSRMVVANAIAIMYDRIMEGNCVFDYTRFCRSIIRYYHKTGTFDRWYDILRRPLKIEVEHLNFDCLCERYKVRKIKKN